MAFTPQWQHALALLDAALVTGVRRHMVVLRFCYRVLSLHGLSVR